LAAISLAGAGTAVTAHGVVSMAATISVGDFS
jgi:hypothetical protein